MGLADDIVPAIRTRYGNVGTERVVNAWNRAMVGEVTRKEWDGKGSQVAASYVDGLEAEPWHSVDRYPWISSLEEKAAVIRDELRRVVSQGLGEGAAWVAAAEEDAEAYGPGWQKLVLQNRDWNSAVCGLFPETCEILQGCGAPSHDIFFARQRAGTGIKPHTDNSNLFITAHLPLEVPDEGRCWIRVGTKEKREWRENKVMAFDSSFVHETENGASSDRIVLLVRFWHPQLTQVETNALDFILAALDDPSTIDQPYDRTLGAENVEADLASTELSEIDASTPASVGLDDGSGEVNASRTRETAQEEEASSLSSVALGDGSGRAPTSQGRDPVQEEGSRGLVSVPGDVASQEAIRVEPLGDAAEAERLDSFLADLKSEGLLPDAGTKDDVLAQGPKNRSERRKATKARKKASRAGKGKTR